MYFGKKKIICKYICACRNGKKKKKCMEKNPIFSFLSQYNILNISIFYLQSKKSKDVPPPFVFIQLNIR